MFKRTQVVMLPTNEKAIKDGIICKLNDNIYGRTSEGDTDYSKLFRKKGELHIAENTGTKVYHGFTPQHLYFLSDEKIYAGNNYLIDTRVLQCVGPVPNLLSPKKIIATTDKELEWICKNTNYEVMQYPQPSQAFLDVFVKEYNKGNVIKEVLVEYEEERVCSNFSYNNCFESHSYDNVSECIHCNKVLKLKVDKDNTITIKKLKEIWTKEEVEIWCSQAFFAGYANGSLNSDKALEIHNEWLKNNI